MENRLSLNLDKTAYIIFGNKKHKDIKICFRDTTLTLIGYMGVTFYPQAHIFDCCHLKNKNI